MKRARSISFDFNQYSFHCSAAKKSKKTPTKLAIDFINHVEDSIIRSSARKNIDDFKLVVKFNRSVREEGDFYMQRWLNYAVNNNVRNFFLSYHTNPNYKQGWRYVLPDSIYAASSLETLDLFGCHFPKPRIDHHAALIGSSLKKLSLSRVFIDQETLQGLIEGCGLLEELAIDLCEGFEAVRVGGERLEVVDLYLQRDRVQIVEIRAAPRLRCLSYGGGFESVRGSFEASELGNGVEEVRLHDVSVEAGFLQQLMPRFPKLEMERCFVV